ncbi:MAG TPA: hypothetical protein VF469_30715 [Kofleriaceae bacterium]
MTYHRAMAAKVCPMCHRSNSGSAWQCGCGYEFGQSAEKVRALLRGQQTAAWIVLPMLLVLDIAAVGGMIYAVMHGLVVYSTLVFGALIMGTARTVRKLRVTRESLRQLAARDAALPTAIVHKR